MAATLTKLKLIVVNRNTTHYLMSNHYNIKIDVMHSRCKFPKEILDDWGFIKNGTILDVVKKETEQMSPTYYPDHTVYGEDVVRHGQVAAPQRAQPQQTQVQQPQQAPQQEPVQNQNAQLQQLQPEVKIGTEVWVMTPYLYKYQVTTGTVVEISQRLDRESREVKSYLTIEFNDGLTKAIEFNGTTDRITIGDGDDHVDILFKKSDVNQILEEKINELRSLMV
jgi:hypothetical protein